MTENEALKELNECIGKCVYGGCYGTAMHTAILALDKIQQYRAIGTVEECREARERQRGKKPNKRTDKYTDLIQHYSCPVCGKYFGQAGVHNIILFEKPKYCTCGQAISWESDTP